MLALLICCPFSCPYSNRVLATGTKVIKASASTASALVANVTVAASLVAEDIPEPVPKDICEPVPDDIQLVDDGIPELISMDIPEAIL